MPTPADAIARLKSDPESFLRKYPVDSRSCNSGPAPVYWFGHKKGVYLATGGRDYDRTEVGRKLFLLSANKNEILDPALPIPVWYIGVIASNDASIMRYEIPGVAVSRNSGPDFMVTPILNGCTFICVPMGHAVLMAHIQPQDNMLDGRLIGLVQHGTLSIRGGRDMEGTCSFGRCASSALSNGRNEYTGYEKAMLIGVRTQERWRVFAQVQSASSGTSGQILRVTEFFNG